MKYSLLIISIVLLILLIIAIQNPGNAELNFLWMRLQQPLIIWILLGSMLGIAAVFFLFLSMIRSRNKSIRELEATLDEFRESQRLMAEEQPLK